MVFFSGSRCESFAGESRRKSVMNLCWSINSCFSFSFSAILFREFLVDRRSILRFLDEANLCFNMKAPPPSVNLSCFVARHNSRFGNTNAAEPERGLYEEPLAASSGGCRDGKGTKRRRFGLGRGSPRLVQEGKPRMARQGIYMPPSLPLVLPDLKAQEGGVPPICNRVLELFQSRVKSYFNISPQIFFSGLFLVAFDGIR